MLSHRFLLPVLTSITVSAVCAAAAADSATVRTTPITLENGFFRVRFENARIATLTCDPSGRGKYRDPGTQDLGFDGIAVSAETRCSAKDPTSLRCTGLDLRRAVVVEVRASGIPARLEPGHTLGQVFDWKAGVFDSVEVQIPTWRSTTSGCTLSLRRETPDGPVVASRRIENATDNAWQELAVPSLGPGRYCAVLSKPRGTIGWWGGKAGKAAPGPALRDGRPVPGMVRRLRVRGAAPVGLAEQEVVLRANRLRMILHFLPTKTAKETAPPAPPLRWTLRWNNFGYDVSRKSVPFFRFFTPDMRYMPTEQLKRWQERGGLYEFGIGPAPWIEADGTGNSDFRIHGTALSLRWWLYGSTADLLFHSTPVDGPGKGRKRVEIEFELLPRQARIPTSWPRFDFPDPAMTEAATTFFYERAFSYPPLWGPAPWFSWNALCRLWQGGGHIEAFRNMLAGYSMDPDGYVYTWGARRGWPFPDNRRYDTRHFDTNARFILAEHRYAAWTGDIRFLKQQAERLRRAMDYQLTVLKGAKDGLIVAASADVNGRHKGVGNNYWDILPFGHLDAYANIVWYASLEAMAEIEDAFDRTGGVQTRASSKPSAFYRELRKKVRAAYNAAFWDEAKGRYIGCIDVDGKRHDYGFTFVNLEAMAYGLASEARARRIYRWMETEPTSSGKADTYTRWIFAPRATTLHNPRWAPGKGKLDPVPQEPWWHFGWLGTAYGDQCQDGGAILYTSFFDLTARTRLLGPDNAWKRWERIVERWGLPDHLCGGPPLFRGEHPQQVKPGAVGLDIPFPESGLVPCWLLYSVLGVRPRLDGLEFRPRLPAGVPWLEIRNVAWRGLPLDIRADAAKVRVQCRAPGYAFTWERPVPEAGKPVVLRQLPNSLHFPKKPVWSVGGE
ncbi:MAG: hypothetical protein GXP31_16265 [Kiritimatiellaeota bacterium]|nr:hypothetical protein [Kiritimatiellota bacterium]